ncbi:MAG: UDP-N-acetylmuramoyl-L-alanyl-D-glutamate--2,6-diaminopimelate ligase [Brachybacterium sp.]|nr:UDP-N-acetylmuramoyl-L-alanyl-D-glutamate--2,6-diaminopimelate ligase [Brachybacterium sp.]
MTAEPARPRHPRSHGLDVVARHLGLDAPPDTPEITGVTLDSRAVRPGDLWCALPGARAHGADFAAQAAGLGAVAALTDADGTDRCRDAGLVVLLAEDPRALAARAADLVAGHAAQQLRTVGITGTNGKTSVATMLQRTLLELGVPAGIIGTNGTSYRAADGTSHEIATVRTTPEAPEVHAILARMREDGVEALAMEVSSHALVLHRADEVVFDAACFTNLSQDHLDFHPDMEDYYAAKARLFTPAHARRGIICVDDDWGRRLAAESAIPVTTYTTRPDVPADHRVRDVRPDGFGSNLELIGPNGTTLRLHAPLPGRHYVANTVAVALLLEAIGHPLGTTTEAIARTATVPGRMEKVTETPVLGVVDYSHTEDALAQAVETLRSLPMTSRLITVMGAGGDRDRGKRPRMGAVAAGSADILVITDDNPRSEDPTAIRAEILSGIGQDAPAEVHEIAGREEAIRVAVSLARPGDAILVAGKGAETGQDIGGVIHPFDDRIRLRTLLAERFGAPSSQTAPADSRPDGER